MNATDAQDFGRSYKEYLINSLSSYDYTLHKELEKLTIISVCGVV